MPPPSHHVELALYADDPACQLPGVISQRPRTVVEWMENRR